MNLQIVDPPKSSGTPPSTGAATGSANARISSSKSLRQALGAGMALIAMVLSGTSHGAVTEYTSLENFNLGAGTTGPGGADLSAYSGLGDPSFSGAAGLLGWTATATGGVYASSGIMSTNFASTPLTFTFSNASTLAGIGGQFFATDQLFATATSSIQITIELADGTDHSFTRPISSSSDFWGFHSSDSAISSLTITAADDFYASAGGLTFRSTAGGPNDVGGVPEPSSLALVAAALGLAVGARRRRTAA